MSLVVSLQVAIGVGFRSIVIGGWGGYSLLVGTVMGGWRVYKW